MPWCCSVLEDTSRIVFQPVTQLRAMEAKLIPWGQASADLKIMTQVAGLYERQNHLDLLFLHLLLIDASGTRVPAVDINQVRRASGHIIVLCVRVKIPTPCLRSDLTHLFRTISYGNTCAALFRVTTRVTPHCTTPHYTALHSAPHYKTWCSDREKTYHCVLHSTHRATPPPRPMHPLQDLNVGNVFCIAKNCTKQLLACQCDDRCKLSLVEPDRCCPPRHRHAF